jgi:GT2 family glycosyltransferase
MAVPRPLFEAVGGFDPDIPNCFEDSWLCIRLGRAGAQFRYLEKAVIRHKGDTSKHGDEIRMQEHNSTYAMLKLYANDPGRRLAFSIFNFMWMAWRWTRWMLAGKKSDAMLLWEGWRSAYKPKG